MEHVLEIIWAASNAVLECVVHLAFGLRKVRHETRAAALQQFREYKVSDGRGAVALDGSECEILELSDSFTTRANGICGYVLTLFVVSPSDRYFLFKSNAGGRPYVKELSPMRARVVLKGRFRRYGELRPPDQWPQRPASG